MCRAGIAGHVWITLELTSDAECTTSGTRDEPLKLAQIEEADLDCGEQIAVVAPGANQARRNIVGKSEKCRAKWHNLLQLNTLTPNPASMDSVTVHSATMTCPGTLANVSAARRKVRDFLRHAPRVDEAELIAAELMSNAIRHTPSGEDGGTFTITVQYRADRARIQVFDLGTETWHGILDDGPLTDDIPVSGFAECGRGLRIVAAIADEYGHHDVSGSQGQSCWATVTW